MEHATLFHFYAGLPFFLVSLTKTYFEKLDFKIVTFGVPGGSDGEEKWISEVGGDSVEIKGEIFP